MLEFFRHHILKDLVSAFGTLFNNIHVAKYDSNDVEIRRIKVPIAYGPKQKFITRLESSDPNLIHNIEQYLPRIGFEMTGIAYDAQRKLSTMQKTVKFSTVVSDLKYRYEKVPYIVSFALHIIAKNTEDALQILEQIVPYFTPEFNITFNSMGMVDTKIDVPISIGAISINENYEGDFEERKVFVITIAFDAKINLIGPIKDTGIILTSIVNFLDYNPPTSLTGATLATVTASVTGGATAGGFGPTGTYTIHTVDYGR